MLEQLVLSVGNELMCAATDVSDPCLVDARSCLELIPNSSLAQSELSILDAIGIFNTKFNLSLLPIQFKQRHKIIYTIKEALLVSKSQNYK